MSNEPEVLADTQNLADRRHVSLQRVGVKGVELPFQIKGIDDTLQTVLASVTLTADLPHYFKGTHMSRFIEILEEWRNRPVSGPELKSILQQTKAMLESETAHVDIRFKYFLEKQAPVSRLTSVLGYQSSFSGTLTGSDFNFRLGVDVPITTVCPCSKAISEYGAHNQRALIRAKVRFAPGKSIWIEEIVRVLEKQGSAEIYPLLKREDEKYVTEYGYCHPKFVEDVVRDCVLVFRADSRLRWFSIECEAEESIHQHSAFAFQAETSEPT